MTIITENTCLKKMKNWLSVSKILIFFKPLSNSDIVLVPLAYEQPERALPSLVSKQPIHKQTRFLSAFSLSYLLLQSPYSVFMNQGLSIFKILQQCSYTNASVPQLCFSEDATYSNGRASSVSVGNPHSTHPPRDDERSPSDHIALSTQRVRSV